MRWIYKFHPEPQAIDSLRNSLGVDRITATLLLQRGISDFDQAREFFRPNLDQLHSPFLMKGMENAVDRIIKALELGQRIMIYGDYDVDGTTAVSLVYQFLSKQTSKIEYYIPDRYSEGYGISFKGIDVAEEHQVNLIIALDCGIRSIDKVEYAKSKGIDFIIADHHLPGSQIPDAIAVLDPKQSDCPYPFKELCGCGIGFKICQALCTRLHLPLSEVYEYLDLVAVSIGADIVPIVGENRILAYFGLEKINTNPGVGIRTILQFNKIKKKLTISDVVFILAPRINAAGRIEHGSNAVKLLISPNELSAESFNQVIHYNNIERKSLDSIITQEALELIRTDESLLNSKSTVVYSENWHKGVVGIVASRLIEKYYRPTIVLTESNGKATGSARSVKDFDVHEAIQACSDLLEQFGGHKYAAGLTLKIENIDAFRSKFESVVRSSITDEMLIPSQEIDLDIQLEEITPKLFRILTQIGPFGPGNMQPVFVTRSVLDTGHARIVGETHLKLAIQSSQNPELVFPCIFFKGWEHLPQIQTGKPFDIAFCIEENEYNGQVSIQLNIKDIQYV
ncbi:MAG: single-stranded-DNA-specific exonuclease RecJ [Bacteroidia bacterium]|nr:single-stranded-DNA-specific exonuclease RecJ [Bacteroidia bacterium]